ncbi:unnamed protein product [Caenorhabditis auriculariae]|uniref:VPS9 domain-containing protein n=1 Tax=Caenorhabditis auriculariae TaxID=2777116 RepID=A0A8S1H1L7_9PELO|nr:unnamed protein product [Caenorhabditis auriculariae]
MVALGMARCVAVALADKCVRTFTEKGAHHIWNCDDLLPAFMYVVIRAQIKHLGAEIEIIDHFTRNFRTHLQTDMMFTMLHSAYIQICREKSLV